jgi:hypothetical protein
MMFGGLALAATTALIGWMHTPGGLQVLHALGVPCPIDKVTTAQVIAAHEQGLVATRGSSPAPQRPALGLELDSTTEAQALAWSKAKGLNCAEIVRGFHYLRCRGVPAEALGVGGPPISEMWLSFDPTSTLIGLNVYRRGLSPKELDSVWVSTVKRLQMQLGKPTVQSGDASAAVLLQSDFSTARVQYRFSNYIATATAANMTYSGLSLREQYVSGKS